MKHIFIAFLLIIACNRNEEKSEPLLACPLLYEFDRLVVRFEMNSAVTKPELYLNHELVTACEPAEKEFCLINADEEGNVITYKVISREQVRPDLLVDLYEDNLPRVSRINETLTRTRTRPDDKCGSGFVSTVTIKE